MLVLPQGLYSEPATGACAPLPSTLDRDAVIVVTSILRLNG